MFMVDIASVALLTAVAHEGKYAVSLMMVKAESCCSGMLSDNVTWTPWYCR